jgi:HAD superfamily hydrolase (TIGR01458 family)
MPKLPDKIKAFFFDLDGTLYFKGNQIPGAADMIKELRSRGYFLRFLTNTDSIPESGILERMKSNGIEAEEAEVFTPVTAVRNFFLNNPKYKCYLLVTDKVAKVLEGLNISQDNPDYVVVGDFRDKVSYSEIDKVFRMIHNGAKILCTNKGKLFYLEDGVHIDTGGFVSMFEYATGTQAELLGKPTAGFFSIALNSLGISQKEMVMVGDDITVDIGGAKAIGATSIMVKTGKYSKEAVENSGIHPDFLLDTVDSIKNILP